MRAPIFRQQDCPDFTLIVKAGQMCRDGCQACENLVFATAARNVTRPRNLSRYRCLPHFPYRFPGFILLYTRARYDDKGYDRHRPVLTRMKNSSLRSLDSIHSRVYRSKSNAIDFPSIYIYISPSQFKINDRCRWLAREKRKKKRTRETKEEARFADRD